MILSPSSSQSSSSSCCFFYLFIYLFIHLFIYYFHLIYLCIFRGGVKYSSGWVGTPRTDAVEFDWSISRLTFEVKSLMEAQVAFSAWNGSTTRLGIGLNVDWDLGVEKCNTAGVDNWISNGLMQWVKLSDVWLKMAEASYFNGMWWRVCAELWPETVCMKMNRIIRIELAREEGRRRPFGKFQLNGQRNDCVL